VYRHGKDPSPYRTVPRIEGQLPLASKSRSSPWRHGQSGTAHRPRLIQSTASSLQFHVSSPLLLSCCAWLPVRGGRWHWHRGKAIRRHLCLHVAALARTGTRRPVYTWAMAFFIFFLPLPTPASSPAAAGESKRFSTDWLPYTRYYRTSTAACLRMRTVLIRILFFCIFILLWIIII
jgi:hypothetical protein